MAGDGRDRDRGVVRGLERQASPEDRLLDVSAEQRVVDRVGVACARVRIGRAASVPRRDEYPRGKEKRGLRRDWARAAVYARLVIATMRPQDVTHN